MISETQHSDKLLPVYDQKILDLVKAGNFEQARWIAEESYEYSKNTYGETHLETAKTLNNLAWVYDLHGRHDAAAAFYRRAIEIKKSVCGNKSIELIPTLENLTSLYVLQGKYLKAEKLLREMIDIVRVHRDPWRLREAVYLTRMAEINVRLNRMDTAEALYHESAAFIERTMPVDHPNLGRAFANIADFYRLKNKLSRAAFYYRRAYGILRKSLSAKHADVQNVVEKIKDIQKLLPPELT